MVINLLPPLIYSRSTSLISLESLPLRSILYCGNCLGRIRWGQAECTKDKCRNAKKKMEHFLELDLHIRLCQLYRDKQRFYLFLVSFEQKRVAALCSGLMV